MSTLITNKIIDSSSGATLLNSTGAVVQVTRLRTDTIRAWASVGSTPKEMTDVTISITPKFNNSLLIVKWVICGEPGDHNMVFKIFKDGAVITTSGEEGYNITNGNAVYSGYFCGLYDANDSSTPAPNTIIYCCNSGSTSARSYGVGFVGSDGGNRAYYQNRGVSAIGQSSYENPVSFATIMEIVR